MQDLNAAVEKHRKLILDTERYIWRNPETGVLTGATEPRADGTVAVW